MRRVIIILVAAVGVAGCGSTDSSGTHAPQQTTQTVRGSGHPTPETQAINGSYTNPGTGMTATVDLTAVRPSLKALGTPAKGYFWEVIKVRVHNGGSTSHQFNPFDFVIRSGPARAIQARVLPSSKAQLKPGQLKPGETRSGWLAYLISSKLTNLDVTWSDDQAISPPVRLVTIAVR